MQHSPLRHCYDHTLSCTCCRYDTREGGDLYNALIENPAVVATSTGFMYRSQYGIRNKASLLQHIQATPTGVTSVDIKDSYT